MSTTVTKPTLTYFNLAGLAEAPRLLLEDAGVDYDYVAVANWAELKPEYQASGTFTPPSPPPQALLRSTPKGKAKKENKLTVTWRWHRQGAVRSAAHL
jgi:hypothetical protein